MKTELQVNELLQALQQATPFEYEAKEIHAEYQKGRSEQSSLAIKIITILGGLLASLTFVAFLFALGLYDSEATFIILGAIFVVGSIFLSIKIDTLLLDTFSIAMFILGCIMMSYGLAESHVNERAIALMLIAIALMAMYFAQNFILTFIGVLLIHLCLAYLLSFWDITGLLYIGLAVWAPLIGYFHAKEAQIITLNPKLSRIYNPVRIGLIVSFLFGFLFLRFYAYGTYQPYNFLLPALSCIACILYLLVPICERLGVHAQKDKVLVFVVTLLLLLPTAASPSIPAAMFILLISFWVNHKTGIALGIIAFLYFLGQYYYDLRFTLLTKSLLLMGSGILFLLLSYFYHKTLQAHEKH